jgi:peptidylprolyl isomerase domain and WD repeat-containing protein 1
LIEAMPESQSTGKTKVKEEPVESMGKRSPEDADPSIQPKKQKKRPLPDFRDIPTPAHYQISFMHRSVVTHVITSWKHAYVITASSDGIVKFWKRTQVVPPEQVGQTKKDKEAAATPCVEFVKSFTAHSGPVAALVIEEQEADVCVSIGHQDGIIKLYEVSTFDATAMIKTTEPIGSPHAAFFRTESTKGLFLAVASSQPKDGRIFVFSIDDANMGLVQTIHLHATATITALAYNAPHKAMYSADSKGILEVWDCSGSSHASAGANNVHNDDDEEVEENHEKGQSIHVGGPCTTKVNGITYTSKMDTQLYQLVKNKTYAIAMCVLPKTGTHVFVYGADNRIRIFHHASGTVVVKYDERLTVYDKSFAKYNMDSMDYGKRAATEREIADTSVWRGLEQESNASNTLLQRLTLQVDPSGKYLLLPTILGVKVIDWQRNKLIKIVGRSDASQLRFLSVCLCWGDAKVNKQMQLARVSFRLPFLCLDAWCFLSCHGMGWYPSPLLSLFATLLWMVLRLFLVLLLVVTSLFVLAVHRFRVSVCTQHNMARLGLLTTLFLVATTGCGSLVIRCQGRRSKIRRETRKRCTDCGFGV